MYVYRFQVINFHYEDYQSISLAFVLVFVTITFKPPSPSLSPDSFKLFPVFRQWLTQLYSYFSLFYIISSICWKSEVKEVIKIIFYWHTDIHMHIPLHHTHIEGFFTRMWAMLISTIVCIYKEVSGSFVIYVRSWYSYYQNGNCV